MYGILNKTSSDYLRGRENKAIIYENPPVHTYQGTFQVDFPRSKKKTRRWIRVIPNDACDVTSENPFSRYDGWMRRTNLGKKHPCNITSNVFVW